MRRCSALLISLMLALSAQANDASSPPSKPIKQASASAKEEASAPKEKEKETRKSSKEKESKESKDAAKDAMAADELAVKIAERLALLRKEKDEVARASTRAIPRSPAYVAPARKVTPAKPKEGNEHGSSAIIAAMGGHGAVHWSYDGEGGPTNWGKLNSANAKCDIGDRQSPIDIRDGIRVDLEPINFDYKPSGFSVIDNGHTIQVNVAAGNYISIMGRNYELLQFHFHKPSEERVNGRSFDMVVHLVHKDADGKLAVVAVLLERGKAQNIVQQIWNNLPLEKNLALAAPTAIDINQLLPEKRDYYTYMGSLTTPPCSEEVLWMVMKEAVEISSEQIAIFGRLYPMNARPLQKTAGRLIKESR
ncbi:carbonic anhydrase family protein [Undibacterium sp. FT147W]|uniref:carbonic anhydrase n=2 Tax=Undibacterium rivi TaxID=2828729 RepID=A0ABS5H672_9BURK|nr:carbonic anhydrase family protein [Undibacterium rivi]